MVGAEQRAGGGEPTIGPRAGQFGANPRLPDLSRQIEAPGLPPKEATGDQRVVQPTDVAGACRPLRALACCQRAGAAFPSS